MSWLSSGIKKIDNAIKKIPVVGSHIPSIASMAPGPLGTAGSVLNGTFKEDLQKGIGNASVLVPMIGAATKGSGVTGLPGSESDPYGDGMPGVFDPSASGGGALPAVGSWIKDHWQDLAKLGIGGVTAYEGYKNNQQSNQLTKDALARLNTPAVQPDLSGIFADPGNPYMRNRKIPVVGASR